MGLRDWIRDREQRGMPCFSLEDIRRAFPEVEPGTLAVALSRYRAKGVIQSVYKGFYVVIPPHYALQKRVPDTYYLSQLMAYLNRPYYISLLSAASFWGASHHAVMLTHVMTALPHLSTSQGKNKTLRWNYRARIPAEFLVVKNGETGPLVYSNPALTALDLVHSAGKVGGLSTVATVLAELREATDFTDAASGLFLTVDTSDVQRLGYIYDEILGDCDQSNLIEHELQKLPTARRNVLLAPGEKAPAFRRNLRWHIDINLEIETDDL